MTRGHDGSLLHSMLGSFLLYPASVYPDALCTVCMNFTYAVDRLLF
jgi:hypothetical protein